MVKAIIFALALGLMPAAALASDDGEGLIVKKSPHSVEQTVKNLKKAIGDLKPVSVLAEVDHSKNAKRVGMELRPTHLVLFGNPQLGTQLFTSNQTAGIDLPMKALVWEDAEGQVWIGYNDPAWIAERHEIEDREEVIEKMQGALDKLTDQAVAP